MAHKGMYVCRNKGKDIPEDIWEAVLKTDPNVYGLSSVMDGKLYVENHNIMPAKESILETLSILDEADVLMYFGNFPQGFQNEDIQPFIALEKNNESLLAAFLAGDLTQFTQEKGTHSDEFYAFAGELRPRLLKFFRTAGEDIDKVLLELKDPITQKDLSRISAGKFSASFMTSKGEIVSIGNTLSEQKEWGWTAHHISGYPSSALPTGEKEMTKAEKLAAIRAKNKAGQQQETKPEEEKVVTQVGATKVIQNKTSVPPTPPTDTAAANGAKMRIDIPKNIGGNQKKDFIRKHLGYTPQGWRQMTYVEVPVKEGQPAKSFQEAAASLEAKASATPTQAAAEGKNTEAANISQFHPIVPAQHKKEIKEWKNSDRLKKMLTTWNGEEIIDPEHLQKLETKYASHEAETDIKLEETFRWTPEAVMDYVAKYPTAATKLIMAYRAKLLNAVPAQQPQSLSSPAGELTKSEKLAAIRAKNKAA